MPRPGSPTAGPPCLRRPHDLLVGQQCRTVSLDHFRRERGLAPPHFLKVDVEGAELAVLRGAQEILATAAPLILLEMKESTLAAAGTDRQELHRLLQGFGYRPAFLRRGRWRRTDDLSQVKSRNILWFQEASDLHRHKAGRVNL